MKRLYGFVLAGMLLLAGCQSSEPVTPGYQDFLENGLGLSSEKCQKRYQFDEEGITVDDSNDEYIVWNVSETFPIAGYDFPLRLDFEKASDKLVQATGLLTIYGEGKELAQECYDTMLAVYHELEDALGEPGIKDPNHVSDGFPDSLDHYGSFDNFYQERVEGEENYFENLYWYLDEEYGEGVHVEMQVIGAWELNAFQIRVRLADSEV